jgi:hypothetical protein
MSTATKTGIELLKRNFIKVEEKFLDFFEKGEPRWPAEKRDFMRNHHKNMDNFSVSNVTFEKLGVADLPANIVQETQLAFDAFKKGEEYN